MLGSPEKTAVALLSSGLDSTMAARVAIEEGWKILLGITFDYGQHAAAKELDCAARIAEELKIPHRYIPLPWFRQLKSKSALLRHTQLPQPKLPDLSDSSYTASSARSVWVPNRNGVFLEIAAGFAEDLNAAAVIVGFNQEEAATFPDNSLRYLESLSAALAYSTSNGVRVFSPTAPMSKPQIVQKAIELQFPLNLLWSCYADGDVMCGRCESCMRLKRGLQANKVPFNELFADKTL